MKWMPTIVSLLVYIEIVRFVFWVRRGINEYATSDYTKELREKRR